MTPWCQSWEVLDQFEVYGNTVRICEKGRSSYSSIQILSRPSGEAELLTKGVTLYHALYTSYLQTHTHARLKALFPGLPR